MKLKHHPHDTLHLEGVFAQLPQSIATSVKNTYSYQFGEQGRQAANLYLVPGREFVFS